MAVSKIPVNIVSEDYTVSLSTSQYKGYYFAEINLQEPLSQPKLLSIMVIDADSNAPAFVQIVVNKARVYGVQSGGMVKVRAFFRVS